MGLRMTLTSFHECGDVCNLLSSAASVWQMFLNDKLPLFPILLLPGLWEAEGAIHQMISRRDVYLLGGILSVYYVLV